MNATIPMTATVAATIFTLTLAGLAFSNDDEEHHGRAWIEPGEDVRAVTDPTYREECGACHMAYQPGLLPGDAWQRIMAPGALLDHYGDDASLSAQVRQQLAEYLVANAAETSSRSRSRAFAVGRNTAEELPRITRTRYFRNEHHEIPSRMVIDNPEVGSFSNCNVCHQRAEQGSYNEHGVRIPGFGRWDD
jgi:hypothetical protein